MICSNGFDEAVNDNRVIQGSLIKCVDGAWKTGDGLSIPPGTQLLVLTTTSIVQCWRDQLPVDTIVKEPGKPLPDVDELNSKIPAKEWELDLSGQPRPPWQQQEVVYLLDQTTAEKFTFASGTVGARIAVSNLRERVQMMRALRGDNVIPIVELANKPMKTRFGSKLRPEFKIVEWAEFSAGLTRDVTPQIEQQPKPAENTSPQKKKTKLRKVQPPTTAEELDDGIPF
jgi:hypothetical protein